MPAGTRGTVGAQEARESQLGKRSYLSTWPSCVHRVDYRGWEESVKRYKKGRAVAEAVAEAVVVAKPVGKTVGIAVRIMMGTVHSY